jgi:hypothetical protein
MSTRRTADHGQKPGHADDHAHQRCRLRHGQADHQQDHPDQDNGACRDQSALPEPIEGVP